MARGRRAKPDAVKALAGNPGKRKLAAASAEGPRASGIKPSPQKLDLPYFLNQEKEKELFNEVLRALPPNMVRKSDVWAIGRWAHWMTVWATNKLLLDGNAHWYTSESNHGSLHRDHPIAKRMDRAEGHLISLEDRIGLNIVARNNIVHKLFNMPNSAPPGELFKDDLPADKDVPLVPDDSAIGFLARARMPIPDGKPN